jgi:hypothetical protein
MKHLTIPLTDEQWRTLKEYATLLKLHGLSPSSITRLILEPLKVAMPQYEAGLNAMRRDRRK